MTVLLIIKFGLDGMFTFDKIKNIHTINNINEINEKYNNNIVILNEVINFYNLESITESILKMRKKINIITFCLWKGNGDFKNISSTKFLNRMLDYDQLFDKSSLFLSLKFSGNIKNGKNICKKWKEFTSKKLIEYHKNIRIIDRFIQSKFKNENNKEIIDFKLSKPQLFLINKLITKIEITIET